MARDIEVLIVEDTPDVRYLLEVTFSRAGYHATSCENGQEAVNLCVEQGRHFDVVLMDLQMPVMDGITAARALRAHPASCDMLIFCLSAHSNLLQPEDESLFDRLLRKPFTPIQLYDAINEALQAHH